MAPPIIEGWTPGSAQCGRALTLQGQWFGNRRETVNGRVTVDGRDTEILSWSMTEIEIKVPLTARAGRDREMIVIAGENVTSAHDLIVSC